MVEGVLGGELVRGQEGGSRGTTARSGDTAQVWQRSGIGMHPHIPLLFTSVRRLVTSPTELCGGQGEGRQHRRPHPWSSTLAVASSVQP
jgi:hypothetical protein